MIKGAILPKDITTIGVYALTRAHCIKIQKAKINRITREMGKSAKSASETFIHPAQ